MKSSTRHEVSIDGVMTIGQGAFTLQCDGAGEWGSVMERKETITCIMTGDLQKNHFDMMFDFRVLNDILYMRVRSAHADSVTQISDPRIGNMIGKWVVVEQNTPENVHVQGAGEGLDQEAEKYFTMEQSVSGSVHHYVLRVRQELMAALVKQWLAQEKKPVPVDPKSIAVQAELTLDIDDRFHILLGGSVSMRGQMTLIAVKKEATAYIPVQFAMKGTLRSRSEPVTVERPMHATFVKQAQVNAASWPNGRQASPVDTALPVYPARREGPVARGVHQVGDGLYLVTTPTSVLLFDAVEGKIVRTWVR